MYEIALEGKEQDQRRDQREKGGRRDDVDTAAEVAHLLQDGDRHRGRTAREDQPHKQVVPHPEELEDRERGDRGKCERQDDATEDARVGGPVHAGALEQLVRYPNEEVSEEEGCVGKRERR